MKLQTANRWSRTRRRRQTGSVLIIVLWVTFGLVALALYFADAANFQFRAADNRIANLEAEQAIAGAAVYVSNVLATVQYPGLPPYMDSYQCEAVPVGNAMFWFIGRDPAQSRLDQPYFYLVDESSKLNLKASWVTTNAYILACLPRMTPDLAANIITWQGLTDNSGLTATGGATDQLYTQGDPPYHIKGGPFESVDEMRLVNGATLDILYGEDANWNGILDSDESEDMPNGMLDSGILDYLTVYSQDSNLGYNVTNKVLLSDKTGMTNLLELAYGGSRAEEIMGELYPAAAGGGGGGGGAGGAGGGAGASTSITFSNLLDFYVQAATKCGLTAQEFALIEGDLIASTNPVVGLVNVNTAPGPVLACVLMAAFQQNTDFNTITNYASEMVAYRETNPDSLNSSAWVVEVLGTNAVAIGSFITGRSYQWTADVAAVGHNGRGYKRVKFTFDYSQGAPRIIYRQDLTHLGWALGSEVRRNQELAKQTR